MSGRPSVSAETIKRVRDYAVAECGYTCAFAAWDLSRTGPKITHTAVRLATAELLRLGIVELIEDNGRQGKVYAYAEIPKEPARPRDMPKPRGLFGELDDARIGDLAPARGKVVPHTRIRGSTGKPAEDARRQARGVRMTRGKGK